MVYNHGDSLSDTITPYALVSPSVPAHHLPSSTLSPPQIKLESAGLNSQWWIWATTLYRLCAPEPGTQKSSIATPGRKLNDKKHKPPGCRREHMEILGNEAVTGRKKRPPKRPESIYVVTTETRKKRD